MNIVKLNVKEREPCSTEFSTSVISDIANISLRNNDIPQTDEIKNVQFGIFSADEILKYSVALINESKLSGQGSIYDSRMGVIQNYNKCVTCNGTNKECPGHFGHIKLSYPILHPLFITQIITCLNLFCSKCRKLGITEKEYNKTLLCKYKGFVRTQKVSEYIQNTLKKCCHCEHKGYFFSYDENNIYDEMNKKITSKEIKMLFDEITLRDMKIIGCNPKTHISNFILTVLPVLPLCARPFVETPNGICDDDLTNKYVEIIKVNNKLEQKIKLLSGDSKNNEFDREKEFTDSLKHLEFHIKTLMDNSKGKARQMNGRPIKCFKERLNGKTGLFRNNLSGKRVDFSARTVIGPDPMLKANEIAIPISFSEKLTFPERVCSFNYNSLDTLIKEDKVNYVLRDNGTKIYDIKVYKKPKVFYQKKGFTLQKGDVIIRNNKKIDPEKFKQIKGVDVSLEESDCIVRNGKLIKNIKIKDDNLPLIVMTDDRVYRNGKVLNPNDDEFEFSENDELIRNKEFLKIIITPERHFQLKEGDIVERHLKNGDLVLFGRQPTLHKGSMIARNVKIIKEDSGINNGKQIKTIRMNLAATKTYNADFDERL
jgi:DNA-directed RNA polymerase beta' subunit